MEDILCPFGQFSGHLAHFMAIWYILPQFGTFLPVLVCCIKKNLATLFNRRRSLSPMRILGWLHKCIHSYIFTNIVIYAGLTVGL
jgi:hypothetical protein